MLKYFHSKRYIPLLLFTFLTIIVFSCRTDENIKQQTEFLAPITSFKKFDDKINSNLGFKAENIQNLQNVSAKSARLNYSGSTQYTSPTVNIPISDISYKIPFKETIENYFLNHPDYKQGFLNTFGEPFYNLSTYTYGRSGNNAKSITFPIIKDDVVTAIIEGIVSPSRDYVQFTVVKNNDLTTQIVIEKFQYEFDNLYPKDPEPMGNTKSARVAFAKEKYIREGYIEEVVIYKINKIDSGGGFGLLVPGKDWWKDANWYDPKLLSQAGGQAMSGGVTTHNKFPDYLDPDDPCKKAQTASNTATQTSKNSAYTSSKQNIHDMNNNLENGVVLGDVNGQIESTLIQAGTATSVKLSHSFSIPVADLHNHPQNTPPSPGDVYALISNRMQFQNYNTTYVVIPNGTTYALVITDPDAMNNFVKSYPALITPNPSGGNFVNFPQPLFNEWDDISFYNNDNKEMSLSYILDKYNTGIALTKMDSIGNFKKINVNQTNSNGTISYTQSNCP